MRYLLDSVQNEESSHSNALCPIQQEADGSLAGEHKLSRPLTTEEFRAELHAFHMTIKKDITDTISSITATGTIAASLPLDINGLPIPAVPALPVYINNQQRPYQWLHQYDVRPSAADPTFVQTHPLTNMSNMPPAPRQILPRLPAVPDQHSRPPTTGGAPSKQQHRAVPPIPDLRIDDLGKGPNAWLRAVHQWNEAASPGVLPLKSWQPGWYQGNMLPYFASKRSQRKTIAEEYAR